MSELQLTQFVIGPIATNCYLLHNRKQAVIFDLGGDPAGVLKFLEAQQLKLFTIFNTHLHFDHVYGNSALAKATGATILANKRDSYLLDAKATSKFGLPPVEAFEFTDLDESTIDILGAECRVLATPGHTPGSLSFYLPAAGLIFCGDLLFNRAVGRTDLPGGNSQPLAQSIRGKVYSLPDETAVYPGHEEETTVGDEKKFNPDVRA